MALVWLAEAARACPGCGLPADETTDPDAEGTFTVHRIVCHACAARDRKAAGSGSTYGVYYTLGR